MKGEEFFGFKVSEKAALILINESGRSYSDLEKAVYHIKKVVREKFGYEIEQEPVEIVPNDLVGKNEMCDNCLGVEK